MVHVMTLLCRQEVLEEARSPLLRDVDLVLQLAPVRGLCMLNLPAEVLDLGFQLGLLVLELKERRLINH